MTMIPLLSAICGATLIAGTLLVAAGIYGRDPGSQPATPGPAARSASLLRWRQAVTGKQGRTIAIAILAGVAVWAVSGWPVAGIVTALAVPGLPYFFGAAAIAKRRIDVLQGLEEWVRRLADSMAAGASPIQTIVNAAAHAPAAIKEPTTRLAAGLSSPRGDRQQALRRFADDIDDPLGDMVVIALGIAVTAPSARTPDMLRVLARQLADDVAARRRIETDRAEPRSEARTIVIVQILFVVAVAAFTSYAKVYGTITGQLVLALLAAIVIGALVMLRRLSITPSPARLLTHDEGKAASVTARNAAPGSAAATYRGTGMTGASS
ncbi:MAG: type II secretion system F family protein [Actinobacteria bacterium]|nr:type II secretion system F family protein [Actinomycetota bacterium]